MNIALDGADVRDDHHGTFDVVIVGSGPAGSAVADVLSARGLSVLVVEDGGTYAGAEIAPDAWTAMARAYRGMGAFMSRARQPLPVVQGRAVGGGSVINGAISWRLPQDVWQDWVDADPALADALPWSELESATDQIITRLGIAPTDPAVAGRNNLLLARGAESLGLEHRPISRNVRGCVGSGHCMQGCPNGAKQSMDRTLLADAVGRGAQVWQHMRVTRVLHMHGRATGVEARAAGGGRVRIAATRGVVVAASAVQTPVVLWNSEIRHGPLGQHFQGHPGAGVLARFDAPVRCWEGATQGHEVTGLRRTGLKFEALGMDRGVLASRLPGLGRALSAEIDRMDHYTSWGVAVKAKTQGRVTATRDGTGVVHYGLGPEDLRTLARGVAWAGRMAFAAGAVEVLPGVVGFDARVTVPARLDALEAAPPLDPRAWSSVVTHLFGTCRMSSDPARGVVRPDFRHHTTDRLWIADSSVFPTNTGVNPQTSILAMATLAGRAIGEALATTP